MFLGVFMQLGFFSPFKPMRIGIQNVVETFCALVKQMTEFMIKHANIFINIKDDTGKIILSNTLITSYLPQEKTGKPSKWVTFYTLLAEKCRSE